MTTSGFLHNIDVSFIVYIRMIFLVSKIISCDALTCTPGNYNFGGVCTKCPSGTFNSDLTSTACTKCENGLNSPIGSSSCNISYPLYAYVSDNYPALRMINLNTTEVKTVVKPSHAISSMDMHPTKNVLVFSDPTITAIMQYSIPGYTASLIAGSLSYNPGYAEGIGASAMFAAISMLIISPDGSYILVADSGNHAIRKVLFDGTTSLLAGNPTNSGYSEGSGTNIMFYYPSCIGFSPTYDFVIVADGADNGKIRKLDLNGGGVVTSSIIAGDTGVSDPNNIANIDGIGTNARFSYISSFVLSSDSTYVITIDYSFLIRKTDLTTLTVTTLRSLPIRRPGTLSWLVPGKSIILPLTFDNSVNLLSYPSISMSLVAGSGSDKTTDNINGALAGINLPVGIAITKCTLSGYGISIYNSCDKCPSNTVGSCNGICTSCTVCGMGYYTLSACNSSVDTICAPCVFGINYCTVGASTPVACNVCLAGTSLSTVCNLTSPATCTSCVPGVSYSTSINAEKCTSCDSCTSGQYTVSACNVTSNVNCSVCPVGFYCPLPTVVAPIRCTVGSFCPSGSTANRPCQAGFFCPNPSTQTACTANNYCPSNATAPKQCTICSAGTYISSPCNASANTVCTPCQAGTNYSLVSNSLFCTTCGVCASGQYVNSICTVAANLSCALCPAGSYCSFSNTISPTSCAINSYCPAGSTANVICALGSYCPNNTVQLQCSLGSYCPSGSTASMPCAAGSYCANTSSQTACSIGHFCPAGSTNQIACPVGYFCSDPSQKIACTPGVNYASSPSSSSCTACSTCYPGQAVTAPCTSTSNISCAGKIVSS